MTLKFHQCWYLHSSFYKYIKNLYECSYLAAAEYITGSGLDVEVLEHSNSLVSGLFWAVQGQTATFAHLRPQLQWKTHRQLLSAREQFTCTHHACADLIQSSLWRACYLHSGMVVHRWVWHGLRLVLTDTQWHQNKRERQINAIPVSIKFIISWLCLLVY